MFKLIEGMPSFAVGITARGEITQKDYTEVLIPALQKVSAQYKAINFIMILETELKSFTAGAWMKDIEVNIGFFLKWNKIAMVSDNNTIDRISGFFDVIAPGEVKTFTMDEVNNAREWICLVD